MADNDVIGGLDNLIDTVSGETPSYTVKDPNVDMVKAINKCIDAAKGITGSTYEYKDPNTDVIQKMDELAGAISESGGGGSTTLIEKSVTSNGTYKASDDEADGYSKVSVSVSPNVGTKSITANGTYTASSESLDGYSSVTVNVGSGGSVLPLEKIVYTNGSSSTETYEIAEDGKYLIIAASTYKGQREITLPAGRTAEFEFSSVEDTRGYVGTIAELETGDEITITAIGGGWHGYFKAVVKLKDSVSYNSVVGGGHVTDGTLSTLTSTGTGPSLLIAIAQGGAFTDNTSNVMVPGDFIPLWINSYEYRTRIRVMYGDASTPPTLNMYGYDGGYAAATIIQ